MFFEIEERVGEKGLHKMILSESVFKELGIWQRGLVEEIGRGHTMTAIRARTRASVGRSYLTSNAI